MATRLRFSRAGSKKRPFYRMVAADVRSPRDGKFIEPLGSYTPIPNISNEKWVFINKEKLIYWISKGAQPTESVAKLLSKIL